LLAVIKPVPDVRTKFTFAVNANFLVVTIAPSVVQEYDLSRIYLREVRPTKRYPLYGHKLPPDYDFDISDYGNCVYLSVVADGGDYSVMVYRSGLPAVGSLYNQIDLFAFQNVLVDASGYRVDYVTVVAGKQMRIFRQYEVPEAEIVNPDQDYQFYLEYHNSVDTAELELVEVSIINLPTNISVSPFLNDIMNTKDLFYSGENRFSQVDDSHWYQGNVLRIEASCRDCPQKARVLNHIHLEGRQTILPNLTSYAYSLNGGELLAERSLLSLKKNGSVDQIVEFDATLRRRCLEVALGSSMSAVGCVEDEGEVIMQVVSWVGAKPFAFEPQEVTAKHLLRLQITNELVMLVDAEPDCYRKTSKGAIYLFEVSGDLESDDPLNQLEVLEGEDWGMRELGDIFINNA
jgi:hypothetical protein